jgi:hypothetical protein
VSRAMGRAVGRAVGRQAEQNGPGRKLFKINA